MEAQEIGWERRRLEVSWHGKHAIELTAIGLLPFIWRASPRHGRERVDTPSVIL